MKFEMTNCIAIGVKEREAAVRFYTEVMGFELGEEREDWTEIIAGPLKLYLCLDDMPFCYAVEVDSADAAASRMIQNGCSRLFEAGGEVFLRDPFGANWCVSPKG